MAAAVRAHNTPASDIPHTDWGRTAVADDAGPEEEAHTHPVPPTAVTVPPNENADAVPVPAAAVDVGAEGEEQAAEAGHPQETTYTAPYTSAAVNAPVYTVRSSRSRVSKDRSDDEDVGAAGVGSLGTVGSMDRASYIPVEPGRGRAVEEAGTSTYKAVRILAGDVRVRTKRRRRLGWDRR